MTNYLMEFGCEHVTPPVDRIFRGVAFKVAKGNPKRRLRIGGPDNTWEFIDGKAFLAHGSSGDPGEQVFIDEIIANNPSKSYFMDMFVNYPVQFKTQWDAYDSDGILPEIGAGSSPGKGVFKMNKGVNPKHCQIEVNKLFFSPVNSVGVDRSVCFECLLRFKRLNEESEWVEFLVDPVIRNEW
jgi:hypothetical protein